MKCSCCLRPEPSLPPQVTPPQMARVRYVYTPNQIPHANSGGKSMCASRGGQLSLPAWDWWGCGFCVPDLELQCLPSGWRRFVNSSYHLPIVSRNLPVVHGLLLLASNC